VTPKVAPPAPKPRPKTAATESIEDWTDRVLGQIFRVTLQPNPKQDGGHRIVYLEGVRSELDEANAEIRLTTDVLDGTIIEAASNTQDGKPLSYLLSCWKRVVKYWRNVRGVDANEQKLEVLREAKRLCMSYCVFAVTLPDMFGVEATVRSPLLDHFLRDPESDQGICHDFLAEAVQRFPEDDSIKEALVTLAEQLSMDLSKLTMNDNFKPHVAALRTLTRYQPIVLAIAESPRFLPKDIEPQDIEKNTILGPFFALSPVNETVAENYFRGAQAQGEAFVQSNQEAVRMTLRAHQDELLMITNCLVKASKESRERLLDWFAMTVNKNHKRRAMYVDKKITSSNGFMINVTTILDRLCEPFMDATFSKLDRIEVDYLRRPSSRVNIEDETKLNADDATSKEFYANQAGGENNFISEIFFLTLAAHHYGTDSANKQITQMQRDIKHLDQQLEKFSAERVKYLSVSEPAYLVPLFPY
jgi:ubiquitin conjugation factor E4 B